MKTFLVFLKMVADGGEFVAPVLAADRSDALLAAAAKYPAQDYAVQTCYALDEMQRIMVQAGHWPGDDSVPAAEAPAPALDSRLASAVEAIKALALPADTLDARIEVHEEAPMPEAAEATVAAVAALADEAPVAKTPAPRRVVAASISPRH